MSSVDLSPIFQTKSLNEVDNILIEVARLDGDELHLSSSDFVPSIHTSVSDGYISAAQKYISNRLDGDKSVEQARKDFVEATGLLRDLPAAYRPAPYHAENANPFRTSPIFHAKVKGIGMYGSGLSSGSLQGQSMDWSLSGLGLGLLAVWPLDTVTDWGALHWLNLGLFSSISQFKGNMTLKGDKDSLANIKMTQGGLSLASVAEFSPTTWLNISAMAAFGFQGGSVTANQTTKGDKTLKDQCDIQAGDVISDPNKATNAISCRMQQGLGAITNFPATFMLGVEFPKYRLGLSFLYEYSGDLGAPDSFNAPAHTHKVAAAATVKIL